MCRKFSELKVMVIVGLIKIKFCAQLLMTRK